MSRFLAVAVGVVLSASAFAQELKPVPVTIRVLDPSGAPIPTANIRHPEEKSRHGVNTATGEWTESVLYLPDGREIQFVKDYQLDLTVSAPGYVTQSLRYIVKKRKNLIPVVLQPMALEEEGTEEVDEIGVQFRRDRPIE